MTTVKDPFDLSDREETTDDFSLLSRRPLESTRLPAAALPAAATARLHGFDLDDQPLVVGLRDLPGEIVPARTAVPLVRRQIGSTVIVVFEDADLRRPMVIGVLQDQRPVANPATEPPPTVLVRADDHRLMLSAEREIVLRCGDASITLTRAGKVVIKGNYIVSRSTGHNKLKGAAVDIN